MMRRKDTILSIRISSADRALLAERARSVGLSQSDYVLAAALERGPNLVSEPPAVAKPAPSRDRDRERLEARVAELEELLALEPKGFAR